MRFPASEAAGHEFHRDTPDVCTSLWNSLHTVSLWRLQKALWNIDLESYGNFWGFELTFSLFSKITYCPNGLG
jgi:hypothetical protein